jgi:hypothetical protein
MPAYLESSNAANDPRYERQGFTRIGHFTPDEQVTVSTMWREASVKPESQKVSDFVATTRFTRTALELPP